MNRGAAHLTKYKDMTLMFGDIPVMWISIEKDQCRVLSKIHMPFALRGTVNTGHYSQYCNDIECYISNRLLILSQHDAETIYDAVKSDNPLNDSKILRVSYACRAVSVLDKYWIKYDNEDVNWSNVNIRNMPLNKVVTQIPLHEDITLQGSLESYVFKDSGTFAKGWRRHSDGSLWLYKLGCNDDLESKIEVSVSNILDKCNVNHVKYISGKCDGKYVCMCKCISNDYMSIVPASEYNRYCSMNAIDFEGEVLRLDSDNYYKMHIVDYLISNSDRHYHNWGFFMDNETMKVKCLHPIFDHNSAFNKSWMINEDVVYYCTGTSIKKSAEYAISKVDFHFTQPIVRSDFLTDEHYDSFMERAKELGIIKTTLNPFEVAVRNMCQ